MGELFYSSIKTVGQFWAVCGRYKSFGRFVGVFCLASKL